MPRQQAADIYEVYVDTNVLVRLADTSASRTEQADVQTLLRLFQRYRQPRRARRLRLLTSEWAVAEAHGVLYGKALERNGVLPPVRGGNTKNVRDILPPRVIELDIASRQIDALIHTLRTTTTFSLVSDAALSEARVWQLVGRIGREAAIYPADSVHLALALQSGCSMLIADDADFLDKIEYCLNSLIHPYRRHEFSHISNLPPFTACGVWKLRSYLSEPPQRRDSATQILDRLGYRFR